MKHFLDELREKKGFRHNSDVADCLGISAPAYSKFRSGVRKPTSRFLTALAREFGIDNTKLHIAFGVIPDEVKKQWQSLDASARAQLLRQLREDL